jgi:hypothetical protein
MRSGWSDTPDGCRVSPFGHPRIEAWSAAPRGLSQPPTSFIGSRRQGIHRWLFVAWRTKMLVLAMEFSRSRRCVCTSRRSSSPRGRSSSSVLDSAGSGTTAHPVGALPQNGTAVVRRTPTVSVNRRHPSHPAWLGTCRGDTCRGGRVASDRHGSPWPRWPGVDSLERR